jgi:hypothetical protein
MTSSIGARKLEETMWEAVLFMGWTKVSRINKIFLCVGFIINFLMQSLFCHIIALSFPTDWELDRQAARTWRYMIGHSIEEVDGAGHSLVARVCQMDESLSVARYQLEVLQNAEIYTKSLFFNGFFRVGPALCALTLTVWCILWIIEVFKSVEILFAVLALPQSRYTHLATLAGHSGEEHAHMFISVSRKWIYLTVIVTAIRVGIGSLLLQQGSTWLIATDELPEIVLNGVALAFILDTDEMLFCVFVPMSLQRMIVSVEPLHVPVLPKRPTWAFMMLLSYFVVISLVLGRNADNKAEILSDLCEGKHDFVVSKHDTLNMLFSATTVPYGGTDFTTGSDHGKTLDSQREVAVQELVNGDDMVDGSQMLPSVQMLRAILSSSASGVADDVMTAGCQDISSSTHSLYWELLRVQFETNASSCEGYEKYCGNATAAAVRMFCPSTCRCFRKFPNSAVQEGCAYKICQEGGDAQNPAAYYDQTIDCIDQSVVNLSNSDSWSRYWSSYVEAVTSNRFRTLAGEAQSAALSNEKVKRISEFALKSGCAVVNEFDLSTTLCADSPIFQPLASYCPGTCGCNDNDYWGCPSHCRDTTTVMR